MNTLFTDRVSYIAFRTTWKTDYKALSIEIRETKHTHKFNQRVNCHHVANKTLLRLQTLKSNANALLQQLADAKIQAAALRDAEIASK